MEALEEEQSMHAILLKLGGIKEAMQRQVVLQRDDAIGAMKCLYWLCDQEKAYTTNYEALLSLAMNLGCTKLSALKVGGRVNSASSTTD